MWCPPPNKAKKTGEEIVEQHAEKNAVMRFRFFQRPQFQSLPVKALNLVFSHAHTHIETMVPVEDLII